MPSSTRGSESASASCSSLIGLPEETISTSLPPSTSAEPNTASVMPPTKNRPIASSAPKFARKPWNSRPSAGRPPRSCVHAAASRPTANTGFISVIAYGPTSGTTRTSSSTKKYASTSSTHCRRYVLNIA